MTTEFLKSVGNAIDLNSGLRNSQLQLCTYLLGLERYFAVCHLKKMNSKTALIILGSIVSLSIALHLPLAWWYGWHINDNGTVFMFVNVKLVSDTKIPLGLFYEAVKFFMPMLILIVTSILIIRKVPTYLVLIF